MSIFFTFNLCQVFVISIDNVIITKITMTKRKFNVQKGYIVFFC